MEPIIHSWNTIAPTQWNKLLRATTNFTVLGWGGLNCIVSVDLSHYRALYRQYMYFRDGDILVNIGYLWGNSVSPLIFELFELV